MDESEAMRLVSHARVARLATIDSEGHPHVVPVVFAVDGRRIVTAVDHKPKTTTALKRLSNVATHARVSLLVDHFEEDWTRLWWVRVDGEAKIVSAGPEFDDALAGLAAKYEQYRDQPPPGPVIVVAVDRVVGWAASTNGA